MNTQAFASNILPSVLLLGLTMVQVQGVTLLSDDFTNAVRVGAPPAVTGVDRDGGTSNDYVVASNFVVPMATGDLASNVGPGISGNSFFVTNSGAAYSISTRFASTTLGPGDSLSLSLSMRTSLANPTAGVGAFRLGLFNSGGTIPTGNTENFGGNGAFEGDLGYVGNYSTTATGMSGQIQERISGTNAQNIFTAGTYANLGAAESNTNLLAFDTNYTATLTLTLSLDGTSMTIDSSFNGLSLSRQDAVTPLQTFDSLSILFGSPFGNATTSRANFIDDVMVTTTVPEPAGVLMVIAGLAATVQRRRR